MLCIEIDEGQHTKYTTNINIRYDSLFIDYSGKYIYLLDITQINIETHMIKVETHFLIIVWSREKL